MGRRSDIVVVDYGLGNTRSVLNAISRLGYTAELSAESDRLRAAKALVLPGVGAFAHGIDNLKRSGLRDLLEDLVVKEGRPLLGICLGMQMLAESSCENGEHKGLGWIPGTVKRLAAGSLAVPHVGWNEVDNVTETCLFERLQNRSNFYFDHSYHLVCPEEFVCGRSFYGDTFVAAVKCRNIYGVQFHPEKSQNAGLKLFRGFFQKLLADRA